MPFDPTSDPLTSVDTSKITAGGALENTDAFRKAAQAAWGAIQNGNAREETGFAVDLAGQPGAMIRRTDEASGKGHINMIVPTNSAAVLHTHNNHLDDKPSPKDIESAKEFKRPLYTLSRSGLYHTDATGKVTQIFSGTGFLYKKYQPAPPSPAPPNPAASVQGMQAGLKGLVAPGKS